MTGVRHGRHPRGEVGRASGGAVLRGVLLVLVAVAIGLLLLNGTDEQLLAADDESASASPPPTTAPAEDERVVGLADGGAGRNRAEASTDEDDEAATDEGGEGATDDTTTSTAPTTTATTTTVADGPRDPEDVTVLVANGSGLQGAAASVTETLDGAGYGTAAPSNVRDGARANASVVYYLEGFEADAEAVAAAFSPAPPVAPMPDPAPTDDLRGASVVLVLGPDLATP